MLGNRKRNGGLDKRVEQISFGQWATFCEPWWQKGWQPHFQPTVAKSSLHKNWFAAVSYHYCNKSWTPQLRDQTLCFFAWDRFFSAAATQGWEWCNHNAGWEWRLRFYLFPFGSPLISFLEVILDPWPAIRNLYKEMKSCRFTKGRPLSIVNESKLNHLRDRVTKKAVKSFNN